MRKSPCEKDCPERNSICHSICKKYIEWSNERQEELERIRNIKQTNADVKSVCRGYGEYTFYRKKTLTKEGLG